MGGKCQRSSLILVATISGLESVGGGGGKGGGCAACYLIVVVVVVVIFYSALATNKGRKVRLFVGVGSDVAKPVAVVSIAAHFSSASGKSCFHLLLLLLVLFFFFFFF